MAKKKQQRLDKPLEIWIHRKCATEKHEIVLPKETGPLPCMICGKTDATLGVSYLYEGEVAESIPPQIVIAPVGIADGTLEPKPVEEKEDEVQSEDAEIPEEVVPAEPPIDEAPEAEEAEVPLEDTSSGTGSGSSDTPQSPSTPKPEEVEVPLESEPVGSDIGTEPENETMTEVEELKAKLVKLEAKEK